MIKLNRRRFLKSAGLVSGATLAPALSISLPVATAVASTDSNTGDNTCSELLSHSIRPLMSPEAAPLCDRFRNQVLLIVNTASQCGFTPQFADLEELYQRYNNRGLQVLGFPSGDFRQELDSESDVAEFCELNYGVSFPMFQKLGVTQQTAHPLYHQLAEATGTYPRWNFNKYLINRDGVAVKHYHSSTLPLGQQLLQDIEALL